MTTKTTTRALRLRAFLLPALSHAGPSDYVYVPAVEYGEREIDMKYGTAKLPDDAGRESAGEPGLRLGRDASGGSPRPTSSTTRKPGDATKYDAFEWENKFQLTETGRYPWTWASSSRSRCRGSARPRATSCALGPLFQWETGPVQWNANVLLERVVPRRARARRSRARPKWATSSR